MQQTTGGVTAPKGFTAAGIHCGVKKNSSPDKNDLALILSQKTCAAAATYTTNRVKAAPLSVTMEHLRDGTARGIVANSGNANACAPQGMERAQRMCEAAAKATGVPAEEFVVASTGVIGQTIHIEAIEAGLPALAARLSATGSDAAARAIMTTDTVKKELAYSIELQGKTVTIGAIAKGSGMIHPNMGTMLAFLTTDCAITSPLLSQALHEVVPRTFNRVTVDGDTSTNDMCVVLANGMAENPLIQEENEDYAAFRDALHTICQSLARNIAADGEGASHLITCLVRQAPSEAVAECLAMSVVGSPLVKSALFGADANWGRVLCAMGYSGANFQPTQVEVSFRSEAGEVLVCSQGTGADFDEAKAKEVLTQFEVIIDICLHQGTEEAVCWGCDLTYDYVKINGDYRT